MMMLTAPLPSLYCAMIVMLPMALSFDIPPKLPNGLYELTFAPKTNGQELMIGHYEINPHSNYTAVAETGQLPLPISKKTCKYGALMNPSDEEIARLRLANWCEQYNVHKASIVLSIENNAVWHLCNYDFHTRLATKQRCSRKEILAASRIMDEGCGEHQGGTIRMFKWLKHYGRVVKPAFICNGMQKT